TSNAMSPDVPGWYCFRAEYTPAAGSKYLATSHTNSTTECFEVIKASPAITTSANQTVLAGAEIDDSADLSGGFNPTGTITFRAYGPDDATCAGAPAFTSNPVAVSGNGTYGPVSFSPAVAGVYRWIASYSGDANNDAVSGACNDAGETDTVNKVDPTIVTSANQSVTIGAPISDSATLSGGVNPTGTITFNAYGPNDATCGGAAAFTQVVAVSGNGVYGPVSFTPTAVGTYRWIAGYSGDANNNPVSGACNDAGENDTVNKTNPEITTELVGGGQSGSSITVPLGTAVHDTSTLSGATADAGGTVHYQVFSDSDCETLVFDAGTRAVVNGVPGDSDEYTINLAGSYYWQADYSGDAKNNAASSPCNLEIVTAAANIPSIETSADETVTIGDSIHDSATLSGGFNPTGTITFNVWGNDTCSGDPLDTFVVDVNGNGVYGPVEFTPAGPDGYHWIAAYSGDANNAPVSGGCGDEGEIDTVEKDTPSISTDASGSVNVGEDIWDVATVSGGHNPTGTVTFNLYGPNDAACATSIFTDAAPLVAGVATSDPFTTSAAGTYRWIAAYGGDANNNPVSGACNDANESVVVTEPNIHAIKLVATNDDEFAPTSSAEPGDLLNFQITVSNTGDGNATDVEVSDDINAVLAHSTFVSCSDSCSNVGGVLSWTIPLLVAGGAEVLTFTVQLDDDFPVGVTTLPNVVVVLGPGSNCPDGSEDPDCDTTTTLNQPLLTILKDVTGFTGGLAIDGTPIAEVGDTLTFTLAYDITSPPANNGVISDPIPAGLEYVTDSATTNAEFDQVSYDPATRTLTWLADVVSVDGSVSFQVTVLESAPDIGVITNVATIDSDDTEPDDDDAVVLVQEVLDITNPPTSTIDNPRQTTSNPGFSLMLILLALAAFALSLGYVTPVPERARRRTEGRRR
ncbi:MAG: DUF11 domain-containing protein, partial [Chloroflexi bacterium]|nr:DUF11 domain-containing protein [Chloroflexota bacterium]